MTKQINCHAMVAKVAIGMTEIDYERAATDNTFYKLNPNRAKWVKQMCAMHIDDARDALFLVAQDESLPAQERLKIWDALCLDEQIPESGRRVQTATKQAVHQEIQKLDLISK